LVVLARQVQGKIYYSKFDDLAGWTQEIYGTLWAPSSFLTGVFYSSPYSAAACTGNADGSGWPIAGSYVRRYRTITIPAGITTVRMQVRHSWTQTYLGEAPYEELKKQILLGSQTFLYCNMIVDTELIWYFQNANVTTTPGAQVLKFGIYVDSQITDPGWLEYQRGLFDELVVARSANILVKSLATGWKAKLYDASDLLIAEATESGGTATLAVPTQSYPITGRFKIYNAGDVLQYTGEISTDIFGGDEWLYTSGIYPLTVATDYYLINRTGMGAPTQAQLTFQLQDNLGAPVVGATISFTTTHGSVSPSSDTTDANGNAETTVSADTVGVAFVKGVYAGDPALGISRVFNVIEIRVIGQPPTPIILVDYDVWIQGNHIPKLLDVRLNATPTEEIAEVEIPDINPDIQGYHDLTIYQNGVQVFYGKIEVIKKVLKPEPTTTVSGRNLLSHLMGIYIESETFTNQSLLSIIEFTFQKYVYPLKQLLLGTVAPALDNISISTSVADSTAYDVIAMAADLGGARIIIDENRYMHVC
jgi:hypothetical protein